MKNVSMQALAATVGVFALLITTGFKKNATTATKSRSELLAAGPWRLSEMNVAPAIDWFGTPVTNVYSQLPDCARDDLAIFNTNGTVYHDEGSSQCDPNRPHTASGTWSLEPDNATLWVSLNGSAETWDILTLTENTFKANYTIVEEGTSHTLSVTFVRE